MHKHKQSNKLVMCKVIDSKYLSLHGYIVMITIAAVLRSNTTHLPVQARRGAQLNRTTKCSVFVFESSLLPNTSIPFL